MKYHEIFTTSTGRKVLIKVTPAVLALFVLFVLALAMSGCGSTEETAKKAFSTAAEFSNGTEKFVNKGGDLFDEAEDGAEEAQEFFAEIKEAGQAARGLRKKEFNIRLYVPYALTDVSEVRVEPVAPRVQKKTVLPGESAYYGWDNSRFVNAGSFSIFTEVNGQGHLIKVRKEHWDAIQSGPAEGLMLIRTGNDSEDRPEYTWIPPSVVDDDQTIRYNDS